MLKYADICYVQTCQKESHHAQRMPAAVKVLFVVDESSSFLGEFLAKYGEVKEEYKEANAPPR